MFCISLFFFVVKHVRLTRKPNGVLLENPTVTVVRPVNLNSMLNKIYYSENRLPSTFSEELGMEQVQELTRLMSQHVSSAEKKK
jgi:hypothetical protein